MQGGKALSIGATVSILLHAAALVAAYLLMRGTPPTPPLAPIMVNMISAPQPEPVKPQPRQEQPQSKPVHAKPAPPRSLPVFAAAPQETTALAESAPVPPAPANPIAVPVESAPTPAVIPPRFDAAYLDNPAPPYPAMSRRMGEQGKVLLRVFVNADGSVAQVELKAGSGSARLDQSALDTVKRWRFIPAKQGAQPVAAWVVVPISFVLGG